MRQSVTMAFPILFALFSLLVLPVLSQAPKAPAPAAGRPSMFAAVGIAVSDIEKSRDFYASTLGLRPTGMTFDTPEFYEIVMQLPGERTGTALVLMKWKTPKQTKDLAIKLVFYVPDVKAAIDKMRATGAKIVMEPGSGKLKNATIPTGFAKDPDGYLLELNPISLAGKSLAA